MSASSIAQSSANTGDYDISTCKDCKKGADGPLFIIPWFLQSGCTLTGGAGGGGGRNIHMNL